MGRDGFARSCRLALARFSRPARGRSRLGTVAVSLLLALTLLVGPGGPLAAGVGIGPDLAHAQARGAAGKPNRSDPRAGATSILHFPRKPAPVRGPAGAPQPIAHNATQPRLLGVLALDPVRAARFVDDAGYFEADVPAGAVTSADVAAAGGAIGLQVAEVAPPAGSNAGGSGIVSFGSYLIQVVTARGVLAAHGLRQPVTFRLHYGQRAGALDLTHAFAVLNGPLPRGLTTAAAATTTTPIALPGPPQVNRPPTQPVAARGIALGAYATRPVTVDGRAHALVLRDTISTPSSSLTWNTSGAIAFFGKPDIFNADLSAGSLAASLPIDVPAGPGGLTPPVTLSYSSAGVSEDHSVQAAAGWAGEGWNLSLGAISWAEHDGTANCSSTGACSPTWEDSWQLSDPYGTGSELIPPNINVSTYYDNSSDNYCGADGNANNATSYPCPIVWHTATESHAKVVEYVGPVTLSGMTAHPPCFRVWLASGIMEEFGCTTDSLEYYVVPNPSQGSNASQDFVYSWLLDLITDPQGNQIHVTYQRDLATKTVGTSHYTYPRDAQLSTIEWDTPGCRNAQTMCTGSAWAPLKRVLFQATHTVDRVTGNPDGYACDTGTNLRCDDPLDLTGSGGLAVPDVQPTYVLNDAYVDVRGSGTGSWSHLRTYELSYDESGPHTNTDFSTGKHESVAGLLDLTQVAVVGDDGLTTLPTRTFTYTGVAEFYEDDTYAPGTGAGCGEPWNTGNGDGCILIAYTEPGNSMYLASASNGQGLAQTFSWADARDNTHGVTSGGSPSDPLYCDGKESQGYPCNEADDQAWSHVVLTSQSDTVVRVTQAGQGGTQTSTPVTSTTAYTYQLTYPLTAQECTDCKQGMYWGNQDEGDYLDYYSGMYMGFAQASVSLPDGALQVHKFDATTGWGIYDTTQIPSCPSNMKPVAPCHNAPWWNVTNAAHGHETEVDSYDTDGTTLLSKTTTQYAAVCPPSGVSGTPASSQWGSFDGNLVSELNHSNPVAVCDVRPTRSDSYSEDGSTASGLPDRTTTYGYSYSGVHLSSDTATTTSNDGGAPGSPTTSVAMTAYIWNDAVTASYSAATGTYLMAVPAYTAIETSGDTAREQCTERGYDGHAYTTGQNSGLTLGELTTTSDFATSCGDAAHGWAPSGPLTTTSTYDAYGNPITSDDADANAGVSGHTGCTNGSSQTLYSACDGFDLTFGALPIWHKNALNQITYTGYNPTTDATGGYGLWPTSTRDFNAQTTTYGYDALGRMLSETLPGEGAGLTTASWAYSDWCVGTSGQAPCVEVDQTKRLDSVTTVVSRAFYDGEGRLVETRAPATSGNDVVAWAKYDAAGHLIFESNSYYVTAYTGAPGAAAYSIPDTTQPGTSTAYDGLERPKSVTDPLSAATTTTYAVVCAAPGTNDTACYEQVAAADPLGHQSATLSDALGRQTYAQRYTGNNTATYTLYATTSYTYDYQGHLTQILHPDGTTKTSFAYDLAGRKTALSDPDRGAETYSYDADGNLTQSVDARGAAGTVYAGYDGVDRMLWRNTTNSATNAYVTFSYDSTAGGNAGAGRLTGETFTGGPNNTLSGAASYTYDPRGRQEASTLTVGGTGYTIWKSYDDAGNVLTQTYPDGEVVTNAYTSGWLTGLSTQQGSTTTTLASAFVYGGAAGAAGDVTGMSLGGGIYGYGASYDLDHRLTGLSLTRTSDSVLLYQSAPSYDGAGNVTGVSTTLPAGTDNQTYCYDEQNRLTWASSASGSVPCGGTNTAGTLTSAQYTQSFAYDPLGRLTSGPLGGYTYGDAAHVHAATAIGPSGAPTWTASYDAAGDMTCRAPTSATTCAGGSPTGASLTYDAEGMLVAWQNTPSSPTTTIGDLYDGQGDRVEQQVTQGGTTTSTVYIGTLEEVSTTGSTSTTTTYYYAGTARVAIAVNGAFSYLASDALGTAEVALDANGNATAATLDAPYGEARYSSGTMPTDYGYTGQHSDAATGLDYYVSRYYDPAAGQFTSADTTLPGNGYDLWGLSRYAYVAGNPITRGDPSGHRFTYAEPFETYLCCNAANFISGASAAAVMAVQIRAMALLRGVEHTVVHALDYQHNHAYYRMRDQRASAEDLVDYATRSYREGNVTTAARAGGQAAREAESAEALMERGGGLFRGAKLLGIAGVVVGGAIDGKISYDEWMQQHPGDTGGAWKFAAARATASTVGSLAGAYIGAVGGAALGGLIGSVVPGPGTIIGAYVGGFVGSAVGGYLGGAVGDALVDSFANVNDPSNPVSAVTSSVGGWLSGL